MSIRTSEDVQAALAAAGLDIRIHVFEAPTATAQQAADAVGTTLGSIVKSLCFMIAGKPVLVLTAGDRLVDDRKLGALYGVGRKKVRISDPDTTERVTGFAPGGVSPVGHVEKLPIVIDSTLQRFETVYAAAGSPNAIFPIPLVTLVKITGGQIADVAKDQAGEP